jgi:hypothetical protein
MDLESTEIARRGGQFHQPSRAICRRISRARRSTGFTSGHASWPHVVEVMERIKSNTRTQGSRYGRLEHLIRTHLCRGAFKVP